MVICPKCGSKKTAPVLYGYPAPEAFELEEQGKIILGGCMLYDDSIQPDRGCLDCGYRWATETLPATKIVKIRYAITENGPCTIDTQRKWIYEFLPDGKCTCSSFQGQGRTPASKEEIAIRPERVYRLYLRIQRILSAPLWERTICVGTVCDGSSYRLQITYADRRKTTLSGDVAGGTFDSIMGRFIKRVFSN